VGREVVLAKEDGDEHAPLGVVGLLQVEDDGNVRLDASNMDGLGGQRRNSGRGGGSHERGERPGGLRPKGSTAWWQG
jgi:hypothetical protein